MRTKFYITDGTDDPMYLKGREDHWNSREGYSTSVDFALNISGAAVYSTREEAQKMINTLAFTGMNFGIEERNE